jgi:hypothetical protein
VPTVELLRVDPRLEAVVTSLFWATFPERRLGRAAADTDGRLPLTIDRPLADEETARWRRALDELLRQRFAREGGAYLREVRDRAGRREELALPVAPEAYAGGAWLVGPFPDAAAAAAWARERLAPPWVHDAIAHGNATFADVFVGDPDGAGGAG